MVECLKKPLGKSVGLRGIVFWGQIFIFYIKKQTVLFGGGESFLAACRTEKGAAKSAAL
jgi:hypothetical protein